MSRKLYSTNKGSSFELFNPINRKNESFNYTPHNSVSMQAAERKMENRADLILDEMRSRLGRAPSSQELSTGKISASQDTRNYAKRMDDAGWKPVGEATNPPEIQLADAQQAVEDEEQVEALKKMSRKQRLAHFLEDSLIRKSSEALDAKEQAAHLEKNAEKLEQLDGLIQREAWNPNSDESFRVLLDQAHQQVCLPNGCRTETQRLLRAVDTHVRDQRESRQDALNAEALALGARISANRIEQTALAEEGGESESTSE